MTNPPPSLKRAKASLLMHPFVSVFVVAGFAWMATRHFQAWQDGAGLRYLLSTAGLVLLVVNRLLWLPPVALQLERLRFGVAVRALLPVLSLLLIGAYLLM